MAIYRSSTYILDGKYLFQDHWDSKDQMYYVWVYTSTGKRIKACEKSMSERGALENALAFLREYEKESNKSNDHK